MKQARSLAASQARKAKIDPEAKLRFQQKDPAGTTYRCVTCGTFYPTQAANFYQSFSPLYEGNNGFAPFCKDCIKSYTEYLIKYFGGDERRAIERVCQLYDLYYNDVAFERAESAVHERLPLVSAYMGKIKLKTFTESGSTYLDTLRDRDNAPVTSVKPKPSFVEEMGDDDDDDEDTLVPQKLLDFWGPGFMPSEYAFLEAHYQKLRQMTDENDDQFQDTLLQDMAKTRVFQNRALASNDAELFDKMAKSYQASAKNANLKLKSNVSDVSSSTACFGAFIDQIERYCPAEYYQDKELFADHDGVEEYFKRFIVRPFKNFITGSNEMDPEFSVGDDETT